MFQQHKFAATFMPVPMIQIHEDVLRDMWHVTDIVQMEVGWFCTVKNLGDNRFLIDGMYLPHQECHAATTEITPAGEAKMMNDILQQEMKAGVKPDDPLHKLNRLDAWFHSHADMDTSPSAQDLSMMEKFRETGRPYFIRGIVNKKGKISLAFYDSRSSLKGFRIEDCPWEILGTQKEDPERMRWQTEVQGKVSRLGYTTPPYQPYQPPYGNYGMYDDDEYWKNREHVPGVRRGPRQPLQLGPKGKPGLGP